jgi:hypothetical protein
MNGIPKEHVERVARMYHRNNYACSALGVTLRSFSRLCKRFEIETPYARRRRSLASCRKAA